MQRVRKISKVLKSQPTLEGAGVKLKRAFADSSLLDPFLLLDDFHSDNADEYVAGFPWHPHRGIETITYMLHGEVEHGDSMGNSGVIRGGDCQWMTAGSGIIHQEMPHQKNGLLWGFQLWANLPASHKLMNPRYQEIEKTQIPEIKTQNTLIKVICGEINGTKGPVEEIVTDPQYLDVTVFSNSSVDFDIKSSHTAFVYVIEGQGYFDLKKDTYFSVENLVIFEDGDKITVTTEKEKVRFLLVSGKPIGEPVAWSGPIVMNTREELRIAFEEYHNGTFIKQN